MTFGNLQMLIFINHQDLNSYIYIAIELFREHINIYQHININHQDVDDSHDLIAMFMISYGIAAIN